MVRADSRPEAEAQLQFVLAGHSVSHPEDWHFCRGVYDGRSFRQYSESEMVHGGWATPLAAGPGALRSC